MNDKSSNILGASGVGAAASTRGVRFRVNLIFGMILLYAVADILTSASSGIVGANRAVVHLSMAVTTLLIILNTGWLIRNRPQFVRARVAPAAFLLMPFWVVIADLMAEPTSLTITRVGILVWWFSLFTFARAASWHIREINWIALPCSVFLAVYVLGMAWGRVQVDQNFSVDFVVSNYAYFIVAFFPVARLVQQVFIRNILLLVIVVCTLVSLKRGAIVLLVLFVLIGVVASRRSILTRMFLPLLGGGTVLYFLSQSTLLDFLQRRFAPEELADGSGRSDIYESLVSEFTERNFTLQLFGTGSGSVTQTTSITAAHNDVLEVSISYGLVGLLFFIFWLGACFGVVFKARKSDLHKTEAYASLLMALIFIIVVGLIGQGIFGHASIISIVLFGSAAGQLDLEESNGKQE